MKKLANLKGVKTLGKAQQKSIFGGEQEMDLNGNATGSVECQCVYDTGTASGTEATCDSCFSYCQNAYGNRLISSWCFG